MIFVTVGTHIFQFNRLLEKVDRMAGEGRVGEEVLMQTGASDYVPKSCAYQDFYDRARFGELVERCSVLITHGGTGTIVEAVKRGKKIIAVPRLASYGEHVDDHQLQLLKRFHEMNLIFACMDPEELPQMLGEIRNHRFDAWRSNTEAFVAAIDEDIRSMFGI